MNFSKNMRAIIGDNINLDIKVINDLLDIITNQRDNQKLSLLLINNTINSINNFINTNKISSDALSKIVNYWTLFLCYEISIISFYLDKKGMGRRAHELILFFNGNLDERGSSFLSRIKLSSISNFKYYNPLVIERRYSLPKKFRLPLLENPKGELKYFDKELYESGRYIQTNPSIIKMTNGYRLILRGVNYLQESGSYLETMEINNYINTRNFLIDIDKEFNILSTGEILEDPNRKKYKQYAHGLEDCRLIQSKSLNDELVFFCTNIGNPKNIPQNCICKAKINTNGDYNIFYSELMIGEARNNNWEKNWLPFSDQEYPDKIKFIYKTNQTIIGNYDMKQKSQSYHKTKGCGYKNDRMRGSSPIIKFKYLYKEGYLYVVHEVLYLNNKRYYFHRFVLLDVDNNIINISDLFFLDHIGIEFCIGLCNSHVKDEVIISYGYKDREAKFIGVKFKTIFNLLHKIPG